MFAGENSVLESDEQVWLGSPAGTAGDWSRYFSYIEFDFPQFIVLSPSGAFQGLDDDVEGDAGARDLEASFLLHVLRGHVELQRRRLPGL